MSRAPLFAPFLVLSALTIAGLASDPVRAAPARQLGFFEPASSEGCPYGGDGHAGALPPGHPPLADERRLPAGHPPVPGYSAEDEAGALPPGHPPLRSAKPPPAPRIDPSQVVDI